MDLGLGLEPGQASAIRCPSPLLCNGHLEEAWLDWDLSPMRDESGAVVGILDTTVEQTARTRSEQALQASEQRNRHIVESISDGLIRLDRDGRIVEDSTSWRAFTGQTVEEWRGDGW